MHGVRATIVVMTHTRRIALVASLCSIGALTLSMPAPARSDDGSPLNALVDAAAQRLQVAEAVAASKWATHGLIEDPGRVQQELAQLGADATARGIDADYVTRVFGDQINATEAIEYSRFADWKLNAADVPAEPPDLASSRSAIDGYNQTMLSQIAAHWDLLHSPGCAAEVDAGRGGVARSRQLDGLYQRALILATNSYCQR